MAAIIRSVLILGIAAGSAACGAGVSPFIETNTLKMPPKGEPAYVYVPFDVPAGAKSVSVTLEYDQKDGKNRLETGVFDERFGGKNSDKNGFRCWSGSVRDSFFITKDAATFGCQKGPVNAGKWYLIVGLAKLEKETIDVKMRVAFDEIPIHLTKTHDLERDKTFKYEAQNNPAQTGWYRGDLHSHTFHSDGKWTVKGLLDSAVANNLDFISITDHNTFSHHYEIDSLAAEYPKLLVIKGEEVTTYGGHINVWGLESGEWVDFRVTANLPESAKRIADEAHGFGALASINHPTMTCGGCGWTYGDWNQMDAVEVWNGKWDPQDEEALKYWDGLLRQGKRITAIGSSDTHQPSYEPSDYPTNLSAGSPTVHIKAKSLNEKVLFYGIRKGSVYVTDHSSRILDFWADEAIDVEGAEQETYEPGSDAVPAKAGGMLQFGISCQGFEAGSKVRLISYFGETNSEVIELTVDSTKASFRPEVSAVASGFVRLEVRNADGSMAAFTNPIWVKVGD